MLTEREGMHIPGAILRIERGGAQSQLQGGQDEEFVRLMPFLNFQ